MQLQMGADLGMPQSRPMPGICPRCHELRVRDAAKNWRIFYRVDHDAILVLGVEEKATRATPTRVIQGCQRCLRTLRPGHRAGGAMMDEAKRRAAEAAGFRLGDAAEFLGLTDAERRVVELRARVGVMIRRLRTAAELSQADLAERIGSSPSRVNKVEHGQRGVSLDLAFKALFAAGGGLADLEVETSSIAPGPLAASTGAGRTKAERAVE